MFQFITEENYYRIICVNSYTSLVQNKDNIISQCELFDEDKWNGKLKQMNINFFILKTLKIVYICIIVKKIIK